MTQLDAGEPVDELDYRESNGITISLEWCRHTNRLSVVVDSIAGAIRVDTRHVHRCVEGLRAGRSRRRAAEAR